MSDLAYQVVNRPLAFSGRPLFAAVGLSSAVFAFFCIFGMLLSWSGSPLATSLLLIHAGSVASLYVYWRLGRWGSARFDCFGAALLLFSLLLRLQAILDLMFYGTRIDAIPPTVPIGDQIAYWLIKGEMLTHAGVLLIVTAWRAAIGRKVEQFSFIRNYGGVSVRLSWVVYVVALAVALILVLGGGNLGVLMQFGAQAYSFGVVAIYFIASRKRHVWMQVVVAIALALPLMLLALGSGMKSEIFFPAVPAALLYWFGYRNVAARTAALVFGIGVLAVAQLYVQYVRAEVWYSEREVATQELVSKFGQQLRWNSVHDGLDSINARINMTSAHAITVSLADVHGLEPVNVFGTIPASFIPRFLWPGKPIMQPGAMHTARIHGWDGPLSEVRSATAPGFAAELYLGGGYLGVLLGALAYGWLLAMAQKITLRHAAGFGHLAFSFLTVYWALRFDETAVVYAYASIVFAVIFALLISRGGRLIGLHRGYRAVQ